MPQELGDFGILVHNGWKTRAALAYQRRLRAHLPRRRAGRLRALGLARRRPPAPLTAGNFVYIAAADLVPQITSPVACATPAEHELVLREKLEQTLAFAVGLAAPFVTALLA